jgi:two-component system nitrate/nitrite response regulator NarL
LDGDRPTLVATVVACDEVLRRGIDALLRSLPEIDSVRECTRPFDIGALLHEGRLDLVVVTAAAAATLARVREALAETGATVLVVVDHATIGELAGATSRLADGFLWQQSLNPTALREALRRSRSGEVPMPPELTRALLSRADEEVRRLRPGAVTLTSREREALSLLVRGMSNKQIANRLSISSHGAKRLVTSIMLKLDAPNRTLAAVTAVRTGLVDDR